MHNLILINVEVVWLLQALQYAKIISQYYFLRIMKLSKVQLS